MSKDELGGISVADLVQRFAAVGIEEDKAEFAGDLAKRNRLCRQMFAIAKELKSRSGDQRRALLALHDHPNFEVRLMAAKSTLAIAPKEARRVIEEIAASKNFPYAGDAGMCLWALDNGISKPT